MPPPLPRPDDAVSAGDSSNVSCQSALSTDASEITVSPVNGAAAGTAADASPIDDVGVFVTLFDNTAGKTLVPVTASAVGAVAANATAVGSDCFGPSDRENIELSIFSDDATPLAVAAVAPVGREERHGSYVDADEYHHRETVAAVAAAAMASHKKAAAAAEACHRREIPYGHPYVELRLPRPPSPEKHDRRQEHGGSMDVPGTGGE